MSSTTSKQPRVLTAGDLHPGNHVTVLDPAEGLDAPAFTGGPSFLGGGETAQTRADRFRGIVLKVASIDLPFVLFHFLDGRACVLDSRNYKFMELKPEFVKAVKGTFNETTEAGEPIDVRRLAESHNGLVQFVEAKFRALEQPTAPVVAPPAPPPTRGISRRRVAFIIGCLFIGLTLGYIFTHHV